MSVARKEARDRPLTHHFASFIYLLLEDKIRSFKVLMIICFLKSRIISF